MIPIGPQSNNIDPLGDRRRLERNGKAPAASESSAASSTNKSNNAEDQHVGAQDVNSADIQHYVDVLKNMDPTDLHRVDELRQNIEDGSYTSELDDLIDPLLDFLSDESELN